MLDLESIALELRDLNKMAATVPKVAGALLRIAEELEGDLDHEGNPRMPNWSTDTRPAPQIHYRINVSGLKRVPDATFTIDGDCRDVSLESYIDQEQAFRAEVDRLYPLAGVVKEKNGAVES